MGFVCGALTLVTTIGQGLQAKAAADDAARAAEEVGEFNAGLIERDIDLLEKQRAIVNSNLATAKQRAKKDFRAIRGEQRAAFGGGGIELAEGTPIYVGLESANELDFQLDMMEFENEITNMMISDQQEDARLQAELSRMRGGAEAASVRAQGNRSLISSLGRASQIGYEMYGGKDMF